MRYANRSRFSILLTATLLGAFAPAIVQARPAATIVVAAGSLGDLTPYRTITADTLKIVKTGDLVAAKARIKDLETAWDKAEATMKPRDPATWTKIDKAIDNALADLRITNAEAAASAASLQTVLGLFDVASQQG